MTKQVFPGGEVAMISLFEVKKGKTNKHEELWLTLLDGKMPVYCRALPQGNSSVGFDPPLKIMGELTVKATGGTIARVDVTRP